MKFSERKDDMKMRKTTKTLFAVSAALAAAPAFALLYSAPPDALHAWAVHDHNRPNPPKVTAEPGRPPSDAVVLFDGTAESIARNWCDQKGNPTKWTLRGDGALVCTPGSGYVRTKASFGDCQLHVEWAAPTPGKGVGQARGNSGVFLMGLYEVQVLDSYGTDPSKDPMPNPNYPDGQAGAAYGQNPPLVNPARPEGQWQTYDIIFHQPVWDGDTLVRPATYTVLFNGVLVQDAWELEGPTDWRIRVKQRKHANRLPISLQDHGNPVPYRNIWIREIPPRSAYAEHGTFYADPAKVASRRERTAAEFFRKIDWKKGDRGSVNGMLEVVSYSKQPQYMEALKSACTAYKAFLDAKSPAELDAMRRDVLDVRNTFDVLIDAGILDGTCPLSKLVHELPKRRGWKK